tara:strand:+ start:1475 stop:1726 length:252 start_codon:yes stop_codon:yes gene_type:complete
MKLFWKEKNKGLDLIVTDDKGDDFVVGGVRLTKRGIEAMAKAQGYDPGRAIKGLTTIEEGKSFVEQFKPWVDFFGVDLDLTAD